MLSPAVQCFVAILTLTEVADPPPRTEVGAKAAPAETTYLKVTYKVLITEVGAPKEFEFVGIEPRVSPSVQEAFQKSVLAALRTWTFNPDKQNGKPVAGWVLVPVIVDLADPIPLDGT